MPSRPSNRTVCSTTIEATVPELYDDWLDPGRAGAHLRQLIDSVDPKALEWLDRRSGELMVEVFDQKLNDSLSWGIRAKGQVRYRGRTLFRSAPGGRGVEVTIELLDVAPPGRFRTGLALLRGGHPAVLVREDLRKFKQRVETGEFATTEGQPAGRRSFIGRALIEGMEEHLRHGYSAELKVPSSSRESSS